MRNLDTGDGLRRGRCYNANAVRVVTSRAQGTDRIRG